MPIFSAKLADARSTFNDKFERTSQRVYQVLASTDLDENMIRVGLQVAVGSSFAGINIYTSHPSDSRQWCVNIEVGLAEKSQGTYFDPTNPADANNNTPCYVWNATFTYGPWNPLVHTNTGDIADVPPRVFFASSTTEEIVDTDKDGNPVVNAAGDYFDPPVTRDRTVPVIRIVRNELTFSDSTILAFSDRVNSDTFYDYPPRTLKCAAPQGVEKYSQFDGSKYYEVTYELHYDPDTWDKKILNQGFRKLGTVGGATVQLPILDGFGQPITTPALLDTSGHPLTQPIDMTNLSILTFKVYEEIDYTSTFVFPPAMLD